MRLLFCSIAITFTGFLLPVNAQTQNAKSHRATASKGSDIRIVKSRPHVYVSYARTGKIEPLYTGGSEGRTWLRFHKNSTWTVMFCSDVFSRQYGETGVAYEVERYKGFGEVPGTGQMDNCQYLMVKSGKSVSFSAPCEHLTEGLAIKVRYRYRWEVDPDGSDNESEPKYLVYFYSEDIPSQ